MTTHIEARFVGHSGHGYQQGHVYQIRVISKVWSNHISVIATHGYQLKPVQGMERGYPNLADFLREWKTLRVTGDQPLL